MYSKSTIKAGFELVGEWDLAKHLIGELPLSLKKSLAKANAQVAEEIHARVLGHLYSQDLNWAPLSFSYTLRKLRELGRDDTLLATHKYAESITISKNRESFMVGVPESATHSFSGKRKKIWKTALMLETGTAKMPARPLWIPVYKELGAEVGIRKRIAKIVVKELRQKGYRVKVGIL